MKFKGKFIVILLIVIILGGYIQITRLDLDMDYRVNKDISEIKNGDKIEDIYLENVTQDKVLLVSRDLDDSLDKVKNNLVKTLSYMKKKYDVIDAKEFKNIDAKEYKNIIFNMYNVDEVEDVEKIVSFVEEGGSIFFTSKLEDNYNFKKLYPIIGLENIGDEIESKGIKLITNLMIKGNGIEINNDVRVNNISDKVVLKDNLLIHITDSNDLPLLWENNYGKGKVFYFNGNMFYEKANRGVLASVLSSMNSVDIYPIMNAKINFIDDFPSPIPDGTSKEIYNEYGISIRKFYKEIWWPDMLKTASNNNMKYTGVLIGTYDDETCDLSESNIDIENNDFTYYTRELLSIDGEIGIHGYNHQPLILNELKDESLGYKPWKDQDTIIEAIRRLVDFHKKHLKNYNLNVYVPPSNITSKEGINAIKQVNKDLQIVSASYDAGQDSESYIQEVEIDEDGIYNLPRLTYEFEYTEESKWDILGGVNLMGYVSHFVHPDDILDANRSNGNTWSSLGKEYYTMNSDVYHNYPWLKATTATEAANKLEIYQNTKISYEQREEYIKVYCDNFIGEVNLILKTTKKIGDLENCTVTKIGEDAYLVVAKNSISKINLY